MVAVSRTEMRMHRGVSEDPETGKFYLSLIVGKALVVRKMEITEEQVYDLIESAGRALKMARRRKAGK